VEGTDDGSDRDDEKILFSVWNQTTGSTVFRIQSIPTVVELNKTPGNEVRKVRFFRVFQKVP